MTDESQVPKGPETVKPVLDAQEKESRLWGTLCHLAALAGYPIPILGLVAGPLVVWLLKRHDLPFVEEQGKEAVNFQLTMLIAMAVSFFLVFVAIGFFLLTALGILDLVMIIIASVKANDGEHYRYPFAIRFIK